MAFRKILISPQYISKRQVMVNILNMINPAHFVVKETPILNASDEAKKFFKLEEAIQMYYESSGVRVSELPFKDQMIILLYERKFCRGKVIHSAGHLLTVYLVDYGIECSVPKHCIYKIERQFLDCPFQAVDLKLLGLIPISSILNTDDFSVSYGPVTFWDEDAEILVHHLQIGMFNAYMEIKAIDEQHIHGSLFISYNFNKIICINDELTAQKFARFDNSCWEKVHKIEDLLENKSVIDESLTSKQLNMSSSALPSKTEPQFEDLTTMTDTFTSKRFLKLQEYCRKHHTRFAPSNVQCTDSKNSSNVENNLSKLAESSLKQECISEEDRLIAPKEFQKLEQLNRQLPSPIGQSHIQNTVNKNSSIAIENTCNKVENLSDVSADKLDNVPMKLNACNSEETQNDSTTLNKLMLADCQKANSSNLGSKITDSNKMIDTASEISPKQENKAKVISENLRTLQKLQEKARRKMKLSAPAFKKSTDLENIGETSQVKGSIDSPSDSSSLISSNSEQPVSTLCSNSLPKKGNTLLSKRSQKEQEYFTLINRSNLSLSSDSDNSKSPVSKDLKSVVAAESSFKQQCISEVNPAKKP